MISIYKNSHARITSGISHTPQLPCGLSITYIFRTVIEIHFISNYFNLILKNCTNRIFSHVPHYSFVARILTFSQYKHMKVFSTFFDWIPEFLFKILISVG